MVSKKIASKKTNEIIKRTFLNLWLKNDDVEEQGLNETVNNSQEAIHIINCYKGISSIVIDAIETVFIFFFFMKEILSI